MAHQARDGRIELWVNVGTYFGSTFEKLTPTRQVLLGLCFPCSNGSHVYRELKVSVQQEMHATIIVSMGQLVTGVRTIIVVLEAPAVHSRHALVTCSRTIPQLVQTCTDLAHLQPVPHLRTILTFGPP